MTLELHTGVRTATVSTAWTAWDTPLRLVVTDPWAMHHARKLVAEWVGTLVAAAPRRTAAPLDVGFDGGLGTALDAASDGCRHAGDVRPFPYGIAGALPGAEVHHPAPAPWQQAFVSAARARAGWHVSAQPDTAAVIAQRCAELVAEAMACGVLVAFGDHVATSGLAPVGGWRVALRDAPEADTTIVAVDGGAISTRSSVRVGRGGGLEPMVVPGTGYRVPPAWRSVAVAAADAADASIACSGALLRGSGAPDWLAGLGLPALLVDAAGTARTVGGWPAGA